MRKKTNPWKLSVVAAGLGALVAAGCAQEIRVPITGQTSDGIPAAGKAVGRFDGKGEFWVKFPAGARCDGTYDALSMRRLSSSRCGATTGAPARRS